MRITIILILFVAFTKSYGQQRLSVHGQHIFKPNGDTIILKGFNWGWWGTAQPQDATEACALGANCIRMPIRWYFTGEGSDIRDTTQPGNIDPAGLAQLDQYVNWCTQNNLWVIIFGGADLGAGDSSYNFWSSNVLRQQFIDMWQFLVNRYKNTNYIAAYEILSEPHPKKPVNNLQVQNFYRQLIDSIRIIDNLTPLIIGANDHYEITLMDSIYLNGYNNIIYTFNYYLPTDYTKIDKRIENGLPIVSYPSVYTDFIGNTINFNQAYLDTLLKPGLNFRTNRNAAIFVNQVGARSRCPNSLGYTYDALQLLNSKKLGYTWWTFRTNQDSTEHGLYWRDNNLMYKIKPKLRDTLFRALGGSNNCLLTSIENPNLELKHLKIFPNPTQGSTVIHLYNEKFSLQIFDVNGKLLFFKTDIYHQYTINTNQFTNGIYFVKAITLKGKTFIEKLIIQK